MLDCLNVRYATTTRNGNNVSRKFSRAEHVPRGLQFRREAIADYMALDMQGFYTPYRYGRPQTVIEAPVIHWHEVKVSRSDWLLELKNPQKSQWFRKHSHFWWLVVSDKSIVRDDLPDGWGLMVKHGTTLRVVVPAPPHPDAEPMPHSMMGALVRATMRTEAAVAANQVPPTC
jgi:hypothetical protein